MNLIDSPVLMRKLSLAFEELSEKQIDAILSEKLNIKITLVKIHSTSRPEVPVDEYLEKLNAMSDRQSGEVFLSVLNKSELQALAKKLDLSVDSSIAKDKLVNKVVERAIGLRLRQEAFAQIR